METSKCLDESAEVFTLYVEVRGFLLCFTVSGKEVTGKNYPAW